MSGGNPAQDLRLSQWEGTSACGGTAGIGGKPARVLRLSQWDGTSNVSYGEKSTLNAVGLSSPVQLSAILAAMRAKLDLALASPKATAAGGGMELVNLEIYSAKPEIA